MASVILQCFLIFLPSLARPEAPKALVFSCMQLDAAAQHDAQEATVTVLTAAETENPAGGNRSKAAEPLSLLRGTQGFPHSPNQPERARTTDSGSAQLSLGLSAPELHNSIPNTNQEPRGD